MGKMADINSVHNDMEVKSITTSNDIVTKTDFHPESKSGFSPISIASTAAGAADIVALAGAFSSCQVEDWKEMKESYLKSSL